MRSTPRTQVLTRWLMAGLASIGLLLLPLHFLVGSVVAAPGASIHGSPVSVGVASPSRDDGDEQASDADTPQDESAEGQDAPVDAGPVVRGGLSSRGGTRPAVSGDAMSSKLVEIAKKYIGAPYRWAGASPSGFDCSGFTMYVYGQAGIWVPRDLRGQLNSGKSIDSIDDLKPGDIVIFQNTFAWGLSHSGIYIGDNEFINAESERVGVVADQLRGSNWERHFAGASRPYEK